MLPANPDALGTDGGADEAGAGREGDGPHRRVSDDSTSSSNGKDAAAAAGVPACSRDHFYKREERKCTFACDCARRRPPPAARPRPTPR